MVGEEQTAYDTPSLSVYLGLDITLCLPYIIGAGCGSVDSYHKWHSACGISENWCGYWKKVPLVTYLLHLIWPVVKRMKTGNTCDSFGRV